MTLLLDADRPEIHAPAWARLLPVTGGRWRVADRSGRVLGHLHAIRVAGGWRYAAERLQSASGTFRALGEFWRADEALDCLRYQV